MLKFSDSCVSSIIKGVRKECFTSKITIPSDLLTLSLLKLFLLSPEVQNDKPNIEKKMIQMIVVFLKTCCSPSIITLKMQIYFGQNHRERTVLLNSRQEQIKENIRPLERLIFQKAIKSKEDYDQLYHRICCLVVLTNGIGDPTDNEILKETNAALKSILTTKDLARFTTKPLSLKEKQLNDICRIVTGILVYNKNYSKQDDTGELTSVLEKGLQKCCNLLESKLMELEKRTSSLTHLFLKFYSNEEIESLCSLGHQNENTELMDCESVESGKYIKSYIICMQQFKQYCKILNRIIASLMDEFKFCSDQLLKRISRVRKTVKFRNAIPVIEIYPQFKDISLSWDRMQEISTIFNSVVDIVSYLQNSFEKATKPQYDVVPDGKKSSKVFENMAFDPKISRSIISNLESQCCQHILPNDEANFHNLGVEFAGFCIVMFVETRGILALGIKEYGLIKFRNAYFSFSTPGTITKFCLSPDSYIENLLKLSLIWPEVINLLNLQKWLEREDEKIKQINGTVKLSLREMGIQTDVHPVPGVNENSESSKMCYFEKRMVCLAQKEKFYRTHFVQTDISNFRREISTQTTITIKRNI